MLDGDASQSGGGTSQSAASAVCACCGEPSRYRCPACDTRTCSLACVQRHKTERNCSGVRDAAKKITISEFDDNALMRDYRFLEGVGRAVDSGKRVRRDTERPAAATRFSGLTPARQNLLRHARQRGCLLYTSPSPRDS